MLTDVIWQFSESAGVLGPFERSVCIFNALFFLFGSCSCTDVIFLRSVVRRAEGPWPQNRGAVSGSRCGSSASQVGCQPRCPPTVLPRRPWRLRRDADLHTPSEPDGAVTGHAAPDDHTTTLGVCCVAGRGKPFARTVGRWLCDGPLAVALWSPAWAGSDQQSPASPDVRFLGWGWPALPQQTGPKK